MDALKQITPQEASRKPEQSSKRTPDPANPALTAAKAEASPSVNTPTPASRAEPMPIHFDVEEAEVEIIRLDSKSPRHPR
jgi:hypothetical protein